MAEVDEQCLVKFCNLLKIHQLLTISELELLKSDTTFLPEKISKFEIVLSDQLGINNCPISLISYNENQLLKESPLALVRSQLIKYYKMVGSQPDRDSGWLWGEKTIPLGCMHVVRIDLEKRHEALFS